MQSEGNNNLMYELFNYYKKELNNYYLIFRFIKPWLVGLIIITCLLGLTVIAVTLISKSALYEFISIVLFIPLFWVSLHFFSQKANKVIAKRYGIIHKGSTIGGDAFYNYKKVKVKNKLGRLCQDNSEAIQNLKTRLESESENIKVKIPTIPSVLAILFVPLWTQFIGWVFKNVTSYNEGMQVFGSILAVIIVVTGSLVMIKMFFESVVLETMNRDSYKMRQLARILDDILLEMK